MPPPLPRLATANLYCHFYRIHIEPNRRIANSLQERYRSSLIDECSRVFICATRLTPIVFFLTGIVRAHLRKPFTFWHSVDFHRCGGPNGSIRRGGASVRATVSQMSGQILQIYGQISRNTHHIKCQWIQVLPWRLRRQKV